MVYIVFGVSGCGKSTIGTLLAEKLGIPFYDADDFHPPDNVKKMASGHPLNDHDRKPWLEILAGEIQTWEAQGGAVLACSALKEKYRQTLSSLPDEKLQWVYLEGSRDLIQQRLKARQDHYMPPELLDSQFAALEVPAYGIRVNINKKPELIVREIIEKFATKL